MRDSLAAWAQFCRGARNVRTIDLGCDYSTGRGATSGTYFCCVAGVGLDGEVAGRANQLPRWLRGHGGYALSMLPTIFSFRALPVKISVPMGQSSEWTVRSDQPTLVAAFANTPLYGGGMRIAPRARMDDGLLDVCMVGAVVHSALAAVADCVRGRHLGIPGGGVLSVGPGGWRRKSRWMFMRMGSMFAGRRLRWARSGGR